MIFIKTFIVNHYIYYAIPINIYWKLNNVVVCYASLGNFNGL